MQIGQEQRDAEETREVIAGALARPLLLDFEATTASDSSTIAYLVRALRRRMPARAKVAIINAPLKLLAELEISRLRNLFSIYSSEDEALAKLAD
jgi:anti-anti-sigma regulatory factor